ncbi:hypothetical protein TrispH2_008249 [Trichoplax sp. H2]|nr:hypothetical protein TrispH2_008249 [Trichoplax sp. H2]|eukprot:RDD39627.1 hypothetical protein TrispH2_008249 [Trichoplax sp. H2]
MMDRMMQRSQQSKVITVAAPSSKAEVHKLDELDDIEDWIHTFEIASELNELPRNRWGINIGFELTGKALTAYSKLSHEELQDYEFVKSKIIDAYHITADAYRTKFMTLKRKQDETFTEYGAKKKDLLNRWIQHSHLSIEDTILFDHQYSNWSQDAYGRELMRHVQAQNPRSWESLLAAADQYLANSGYQDFKKNKPNSNKDSHGNNTKKTYHKPKAGEKKLCYTCGSDKHLANACPERYDLKKRKVESKKSKIIDAYHITADAYRTKFMTLKRKQDETFTEYGAKKKDLLNRWIQHSHLSIEDTILFDHQYSNWSQDAYGRELMRHVQTQNPRSWESLLAAADQYLANSGYQDFKKNKPNSNKDSHGNNTTKTYHKPKAGEKKSCYTCGSDKHLANACPERYDLKKRKEESKKVSVLQIRKSSEVDNYVIDGYIQGKPTKILAEISLVRKDFVEEKDIDYDVCVEAQEVFNQLWYRYNRAFLHLVIECSSKLAQN